jgi:hypothetical protein
MHTTLSPDRGDHVKDFFLWRHRAGAPMTDALLIAEHSIISNRAHAHILPASWTTLYELTKAPADASF